MTLSMLSNGADSRSSSYKSLFEFQMHMSVSESDSEILSECYQGGSSSSKKESDPAEAEAATTKTDVVNDNDVNDVFSVATTDVKDDSFASANVKNKTTNPNSAGR